MALTGENNTFRKLLDEHPYLVADGAMGTTLFSFGLEGGGCPELLNVEQPELVEKVHRSFIDAGCRHHPHQHLWREPAPPRAAPSRGQGRGVESGGSRDRKTSS